MDPIAVAIEASQTAVTLAPERCGTHWARAIFSSSRTTLNRPSRNTCWPSRSIPTFPRSTWNWAWPIGRLSDRHSAIQQYTLANTYNPSDIRPYLYSSRALASIGEYAKATQYAESAVTNADRPISARQLGLHALQEFRMAEGPEPVRPGSPAVARLKMVSHPTAAADQRRYPHRSVFLRLCHLAWPTSTVAERLCRLPSHC